MAQYSREILVPYLQDICSIHLAERKLNNKIAYLEQTVESLQAGKSNPLPQKPKETFAYRFVMPWLVAVLVSMLLLIRFVIWSLSLPNHFPWGESWRLFFKLHNLGGIGVCVILVGIGVFAAVQAISAHKNNVKLENKYKKDMRTYQVTEEKNRLNRQRIPDLQKAISKYKTERDKVAALRQNAYSANVIPRQYRDIYAAVYLYDWFSTSRATDLDMALNMFVLEQIKDKLDRIIQNQSEMILNQYIMMANQQQALDLQERNSYIMRSKLDRIAASNEERNMYLSMIESNTATTAYFATADYIKKL